MGCVDYLTSSPEGTDIVLFVWRVVKVSKCLPLARTVYRAHSGTEMEHAPHLGRARVLHIVQQQNNHQSACDKHFLNLPGHSIHLDANICWKKDVDIRGL